MLRDKEDVLGSNHDGKRPEGTCPEYWTLSHRWGDPEDILQLLKGNHEKKTRSNERHFRHGITRQELSPTFRDAMEVVHKLGYRYIWVDSLCISQDSTSDWERESRTMKDIYGNTFCNISAIRSSYDTSLGLFGPRHMGLGLLFPFSTAVESVTPYSGKYQTEFWNSWYDSLWIDEVDKAPLSNRGWVVQERFLARRTIHFTRHQIYWECLEYSRCEADPEDQLAIFDRTSVGLMQGATRGYKMALRIVNKHLLLKTCLKGHDWDTVQAFWRTMVGIYSRCDLTRESDRLIAISGVAQKFQEVDDVKFFAGLCVCERNFHTELMWRSKASEGAAVRRSEGVAPSWSWASLCGEIVTESVQYYGIRGAQLPAPLIDLIEARIEPKGPDGDAIGLLKTAELDIECWLLYYKWVGKSKVLEFYADQALSKRVLQFNGKRLKPALDTEELVRKYQQDIEIEGVCLPIYSHGLHSTSSIVTVEALLLERVSGSTYRRLGALDYAGDNHSWEIGVRTQITLI